MTEIGRQRARKKRILFLLVALLVLVSLLLLSPLPGVEEPSPTALARLDPTAASESPASAATELPAPTLEQREASATVEEGTGPGEAATAEVELQPQADQTAPSDTTPTSTATRTSSPTPEEGSPEAAGTASLERTPQAGQTAPARATPTSTATRTSSPTPEREKPVTAEATMGRDQAAGFEPEAGEDVILTRQPTISAGVELTATVSLTASATQERDEDESREPAAPASTVESTQAAGSSEEAEIEAAGTPGPTPSPEGPEVTVESRPALTGTQPAATDASLGYIMEHMAGERAETEDITKNEASDTPEAVQADPGSELPDPQTTAADVPPPDRLPTTGIMERGQTILFWFTGGTIIILLVSAGLRDVLAQDDTQQ